MSSSSYVLTTTGMKNKNYTNTEYENITEQNQRNSQLEVYKPMSL